MARTVRQLLIDSLRTIGAIGAVEIPTGEEIGHALNELNNLTAMLDLKKLYPYVEVTTTGTLVPSQEFYTVGSGADIDTARPNSITTFAINYGGIYRPLKQESTISFDNEARVITFGSIPSVFVYRTKFPLSEIQIWPVPTEAFEYSMTSNIKQLEFGLNDEILLPSGYYPLLQYNLAELLLIHYPNPAKLQMISSTANRILGDMMRQNSKSGKLKNDFGGQRGKYDILTDSYTR
tara:strand:- start:1111 stop:1815 length:705 start_codon:yes stop_codon:yes gene_type:complete